MQNTKVIGCSVAAAFAVVISIFIYTGKTSLASKTYPVHIVNIERLEPFGPGSILNDLCDRCTMISDSELNIYYSSSISYAELIEYGEHVTFVYEQKPTARLCSKREETRCIRVASVVKHGLSNLPSQFD